MGGYIEYVDFLITAVLTLGATARVTRLISTDRFPFGRVRDWALTRYGDTGWLPALLECPWCVGVWVAAPAAASAYAWGDQWWWQALAAWMALAFVASALVVTTNHQAAEEVAAPDGNDADEATPDAADDAGPAPHARDLRSGGEGGHDGNQPPADRG